MERIERTRYWNAPVSRVVSNAPKMIILSPIRAYLPSRKPQEAGAILTTPEQMVQVVAQRSGRPIRETRRCWTAADAARQ